MSRPWWVISIKTEGLVSTVEEQTKPGERRFIIRGQPGVRDLSAVTWGPVAALMTAFLFAALAVALNMPSLPWVIRAPFIFGFLAAPALAWGAVTLWTMRQSTHHIQAERDAHSREYSITLKTERGELVYTTPTHPEAHIVIRFDAIQQAKVSHPIGGRVGHDLRLTLDTVDGPFTLLDETLGTQAQKTDLAHEIQAALDDFASRNGTES